MTKEELQKGMAEFPYWYHRIELPHGVTTPGWAPIAVDAYKVAPDLSGKRVLDVGAWDGFWSFEALKRGAKEVVAIDDFSDYLGSLESSDRHAWETFDFCRKAFGYSEDQCSRHELTVYDLTPETFGTFDVVFFFGTLYHLRYPLFALDKLSAVCTEDIYIESAVSDAFSPYQGGMYKGYPGGQFVAEFYPGKEYGNNETNWWAPTTHCLAALTFAAGFEHVEAWTLTDKPENLSHCRGFAHGTKAGVDKA